MKSKAAGTFLPPELNFYSSRELLSSRNLQHQINVYIHLYICIYIHYIYSTIVGELYTCNMASQKLLVM